MVSDFPKQKKFVFLPPPSSSKAIQTSLCRRRYCSSSSSPSSPPSSVSFRQLSASVSPLSSSSAGSSTTNRSRYRLPICYFCSRRATPSRPFQREDWISSSSFSYPRSTPRALVKQKTRTRRKTRRRRFSSVRFLLLLHLHLEEKRFCESGAFSSQISASSFPKSRRIDRRPPPPFRYCSKARTMVFRRRIHPPHLYHRVVVNCVKFSKV